MGADAAFLCLGWTFCSQLAPHSSALTPAEEDRCDFYSNLVSALALLAAAAPVDGALSTQLTPIGLGDYPSQRHILPYGPEPSRELSPEEQKSVATLGLLGAAMKGQHLLRPLG